MSSYNEWESDLSSIIEKTNQNLKLLRRIGETRTDSVGSGGSDVSTTVRAPSTSNGGGSASTRYAAEDAASYRPLRVHSGSFGASSTASSSARVRTTSSARHHDGGEDHGSASRRSASGGSRSRSGTAPTIRVRESDIPGDIPTYVIEDMKKNLETTLSSRAMGFEKQLADLRTDFTVLTSETTTLGQKFAELRESVVSKIGHIPGVLQSLQETSEAIARLERHSVALQAWKLAMDEGNAEVTSKMKAFQMLQDKILLLEYNLDNLANTLKNRPRNDERVDQVREKVALIEQKQEGFVDIKAVEHLLNVRLTRAIHELEGRVDQKVSILSDKLETKLQALEKTVQLQRHESILSLKNELTEEIQRVQAQSTKKSDLASMQNTQAKIKDDLVHVNEFMDRQEKKIQDFKENAALLRDELNATKQELTKALHAQQTRVSSTLDDRVAELSVLAKDKNAKLEQQVAQLSKKQKKMDETAKQLADRIGQVKDECKQQQQQLSSGQEKDNEKLRHRLTQSLAELEALATAKNDVERHYAKQEKQFQAKLKSLRTQAEQREQQKEAQRLELMARIQEETKQMGIAQGRVTVVETLLAKEKLENEEKNEAILKSRKEMTAVRQKMRSLEQEVDQKMQKLSTELHAKQMQVDTLTKQLKKSDEETARMKEVCKRDGKALRHVQVTKEHELLLAKLKLTQMEQANAKNGKHEEGRQAEATAIAKTAEAEKKRKELEQLLLESQLEMSELKQDMAEMKTEYEHKQRLGQHSMEEEMRRVSKEYEAKLENLETELAENEEAMKQLRANLIEKSDLEAVEDELMILKDEKKSLVEVMKRTQAEHDRVLKETETNLRHLHETELSEMKSKMEARLRELEEVQTNLEQSKDRITMLEREIARVDDLRTQEINSLTDELNDSRAKMDRSALELVELTNSKLQVEQELTKLQVTIHNLTVEGESKFNEIEALSQRERDLQTELDKLSETLEERETELAEAMRSDEQNQRKVVELTASRDELERRLLGEVERVSQTLNDERTASEEREQDMETTIRNLEDELEEMKHDSKEHQATHGSLSNELEKLKSALKTSQHREQELQAQLDRVIDDLTTISKTERRVDGVPVDDELISQCFDKLRDRRNEKSMELEKLHADYTLAVQQATSDALALKTLETQVQTFTSQTQELEALVAQLKEELEEQYAVAANHAQNAGELEHELSILRKQKQDLEHQLHTKTRECEDREAHFERQLQQHERGEQAFRDANAKLTHTMQTIRLKMDAIEVSKAQELDVLNARLMDLEVMLDVRPVVHSRYERDFYATQQEIVARAQEIGTLYTKLTQSFNMLEWNDLNALIYNGDDVEGKMDRLRTEKERERAKLQSTEQEILSNVDFLQALKQSRDLSQSGDSTVRDDLMAKYIKSAPEMVAKLQQLELRLQNMMTTLPLPVASVLPPLPEFDDVIAEEDEGDNASLTEQTLTSVSVESSRDFDEEESESLMTSQALSEADTTQESADNLTVGQEEQSAELSRDELSLDESANSMAASSELGARPSEDENSFDQSQESAGSPAKEEQEEAVSNIFMRAVRNRRRTASDRKNSLSGQPQSGRDRSLSSSDQSESGRERSYSSPDRQHMVVGHIMKSFWHVGADRHGHHPADLNVEAPDSQDSMDGDELSHSHDSEGNESHISDMIPLSSPVEEPPPSNVAMQQIENTTTEHATYDDAEEHGSAQDSDAEFVMVEDPMRTNESHSAEPVQTPELTSRNEHSDEDATELDDSARLNDEEAEESLENADHAVLETSQSLSHSADETENSHTGSSFDHEQSESRAIVVDEVDRTDDDDSVALSSYSRKSQFVMEEDDANEAEDMDEAERMVLADSLAQSFDDDEQLMEHANLEDEDDTDFSLHRHTATHDQSDDLGDEASFNDADQTLDEIAGQRDREDADQSEEDEIDREDVENSFDDENSMELQHEHGFAHANAEGASPSYQVAPPMEHQATASLEIVSMHAESQFIASGEDMLAPQDEDELIDSESDASESQSASLQNSKQDEESAGDFSMDSLQYLSENSAPRQEEPRATSSGVLNDELEPMNKASVNESDEEGDDMDAVERLLVDESSSVKPGVSAQLEIEQEVEEHQVSNHSNLTRTGYDDQESEDEEQEDRSNVSLPPAPMQLASSQFVTGGRSQRRGVGLLNDALSAHRTGVAEQDGDDDLDEVERLMMQQSQSHRTTGAKQNDEIKVDNAAEFDVEDSLEQSLRSDQEHEESASLDTNFPSHARIEFDEHDSMDDSQLSETGNAGHHNGPTTVDHGHDEGFDDLDDSDDAAMASEASSSRVPFQSQQPLPALTKKPFGIGRRSAEFDDLDEDMDEVEQLLLAQSSMKQKVAPSVTTVQYSPKHSIASRIKHLSADDDNEFDDEFSQATTHHSPGQSSARTSQVNGHGAAMHDDDDDDEFGFDDHDIDLPSVQASLTGESRRHPTVNVETEDDRESSSDEHGACATPTRIPILDGSSLAYRIDAIPSMLQTSGSLSKPVTTPTAAAGAEDEDDEHQEEEEDDNEYMEESFDLEESLQEDD